jgi:phage baseplate assembly protein W
MAFEVRKINPLDLQPRKAIGVSLPFSGQGVFNSTYQTKDALKANLINFFLTETGERFLNPTLGTKLRALLFDSLTEEKVKQIDFIIKEDLKLNFPKVEPVEITTTGIPDRNTVQFYLKYKVSETNIEDELAINFEQ